MIVLMAVLLWIGRRQHPEMFDSLLAAEEVRLAIEELTSVVAELGVPSPLVAAPLAHVAPVSAAGQV